MSIGTQIAWDDSVLPFQLDKADIRGRFARLSPSLTEILGQQDYPPKVQELVVEATLLTAVIGQSIDLRWKLSLQVRGEGAVKLIATDYFAPETSDEPARLRTYASFDAKALVSERSAFDQIGEGVFGILIDQGRDTAPYQGITPLAGGSLCACAETYFAQSEQLPTRFATAFEIDDLDSRRVCRAGAVMIQHLPKASPFAAGDQAQSTDGLLRASDLFEHDDEENWSRVNLLLDTVTNEELIGPAVTPPDTLIRLFHEEQPRVFDARLVKFGCTCSEQRVRDSLAGFSPEELADLVTESGMITADCQFCGAYYEFSPDALGQEG